MVAIGILVLVWVILSLIGTFVFLTNFGSVRSLSTWKSFCMVIAFANLGAAIFLVDRFRALVNWGRVILNKK